MKQGKIVAKLLPTEARLRDSRPKFRNAKAKQKKKLGTTRNERKGKETKGRRVTVVIC